MFSIVNKTTKKVPKVPFSDICKTILGQDYELSLVLCGDTLSRRLNNSYRQKDKPTNILSFPLEKNLGEIFINLKQVNDEYRQKSKEFFPQYSASLPRYSAFLFIHGCLHLKGYEHSSKMEEQEEFFLNKFSNGSKYNNGNRHRNILDKGGCM